jgi:hypothetical protein
MRNSWSCIANYKENTLGGIACYLKHDYVNGIS